MKALFVNPQIDRSLLFTEREIPEVKSEEVVVKLKASALNHRDLLINKGWDYVRTSPPFIPGADGAGVIHAIGENVTEWKVGDKVIIVPLSYVGFNEDGTFAEYARVHKNYLAKMPEHLNFESAAGLGLCFGTAWRMISTKAKLKSGETLLIPGIGGGVALAALQLAVAMGAKVIVTSSSDEKLEMARAMGAMGCINYKKENISEKVMELTDGEGVHVAIEGGGKESFRETLASMAIGGRMVFYGDVTGHATFSTYDMQREMTLMLSTMFNEEEMQQAIDFIIKNQIVPVVSTVFPITEGLKAYEFLESGKQFGKVILTF
jgi:zinc-binding alcohol dehydrogenase/oxidoreductase